jgi:hypothetical protein
MLESCSEQSADMTFSLIAPAARPTQKDYSVVLSSRPTSFPSHMVGANMVLRLSSANVKSRSFASSIPIKQPR